MAENYDGACTCCKCCWRFIFTSGLTALFMWLSLRTSNPTCSIQDFYVPALNLTNNSATNHSIYFDLQLQNGMNDKGVHYANINLTFFYNSTIPIANYTIPQFKQGHKKKARRKHLVEAIGLPWAAAAIAVNGSSVNFRVGLATRVKFKILFWYTKQYNLVVAGDVAVNKSGWKDHKKGIKLKSGSPDSRSHWMGPIVAVALVALL